MEIIHFETYHQQKSDLVEERGMRDEGSSGRRASAGVSSHLL